MMLCSGMFLFGTFNPTKMDEFSEKFQGGGVISNPNIYIAKFGPLNRAFSAWKWYKRVFSGYVFSTNCHMTASQYKGKYLSGASSKNIARGTTDPEIESVHLSNLLNNSIS